MYVIEFLALVDLCEVAIAGIAAVAIAKILAKAAKRRGCGCDYCGSDIHDEDEQVKLGQES